MPEDDPPPCSWSWRPTNEFEIDLMIDGDTMTWVIDSKDRREVAESLSRLAEAVHPDGPRLLWEFPDTDESAAGVRPDAEEADRG